MKEVFLFVYGTLRKDFGLELAERITNNLHFVAHGKVSGVLYDLGAYPGAVPASRGEKITGDVYRIKDAENVFAVLDAYEGPGYRRQKAEVTMASNEHAEVWMYWYTGAVNERQRITGTDYLDYLKIKDRLE
jgi:gamma-glutamylcyclotransferase (GGCT)/AIG2-like uncharacterized protein YtfP